MENDNPVQELEKTDSDMSLNKTMTSEEADLNQAEKAYIKAWVEKIDFAKQKRFEQSWKMMCEDIDFVYGLQWKMQTTLSKEERYIANVVLESRKQKVATLYARNPDVEFQRRPRLDFALWDGKMETLQACLQSAMTNPADVESVAILQDFLHGEQFQHTVDRVGKTLQCAYQYQCDSQVPDYKVLMETTVGNAVDTGVGFIRVCFSREYESGLPNENITSPLSDRMKQAVGMVRDIEEGKQDTASQKTEKLRILFESIQSSLDSGDELHELSERISFEHVSPFDIIPDPNTKQIKGWIGARWLVQQRLYTVDMVNSVFELTGEDQVKCSDNNLQMYSNDGEPIEMRDITLTTEYDPKQTCVRIYEVFDLDTKSRFVICKGHSKYLSRPKQVDPETSFFFPIFGLTFNQTTVEKGGRASIFPPSDIRLMRSQQKEINRSRESFRKHRKANAPLYAIAKGTLTAADKEAILDADDSEIVEFEGIAPGADVNNVLQILQKNQINPINYEIDSFIKDIQLATGMQQADLGPAQANVTATNSSIAANARLTVSSANVDAINDFLSHIAFYCGQVMFRGFSEETIFRIVGTGAVWPSQDVVEDYVNSIYLQAVASSSGKPNRELDKNNAMVLVPLLQTAGANPQAIIRYVCKILDDRINPEDFFPAPGVVMPPVTQQPVFNNPQVSQQLMNGGSVSQPANVQNNQMITA